MAHRDVRGVAQALFKHKEVDAIHPLTSAGALAHVFGLMKDIGLIDALQSFNAEFMFAPGCSRWALKRRTQGDDANPAFSRASSRLPENPQVFSPTCRRTLRLTTAARNGRAF